MYWEFYVLMIDFNYQEKSQFQQFWNGNTLMKISFDKGIHWIIIRIFTVNKIKDSTR